MRSRYAAFAKKHGAYLLRTLHGTYPERMSHRTQAEGEIAASVGELRYTGLTILDSTPEDADGVSRVLFLAKVFQRGKDLSFVELSEFLNDGDGLRYAAGDQVPLRSLKGDVSRLRIEEMLSRAQGGSGGLFD